MTTLSPIDAALEGVRVIRREPKAFLYWIAVWALALAAIAIIRQITGALAPVDPAGNHSVVSRFGPLVVVLAPTLLVLWVMTTATVLRAILRPGEHGWHLFKLGPDEARLAILSAAETVLLALLGGVPAYLLLVLLNPIFEVAPTFNRITALVGFVGTVLIDVWLAVRLSLVPVQTFAERGFPIRRYWPFARGSFWPMLASYVLVAVEVLGFIAISSLVGLVLGSLGEAAIHWRAPTLLHRVVLLGLAVVLALFAAVSSVVPLVLIYACRAYVYRAIALKDAALRAQAEGAPEPA